MRLDRSNVRVLIGGVLVAVLVGIATFTVPDLVFAREAVRDTDVPASVFLSDLPPEAQVAHQRILHGGPFPYPHRDGSVFGNRERRLPREPRGFYREYTVETPGSRDRGARRIICGGRQQTRPEVCFYTQDHYASFSRIAP